MSKLNPPVQYRFMPFESVRIKVVDCPGFVISRMSNAQDEHEYKVQFWMDSKRNADWFYDFELEPNP